MDLSRDLARLAAPAGCAVRTNFHTRRFSECSTWNILIRRASDGRPDRGVRRGRDAHRDLGTGRGLCRGLDPSGDRVQGDRGLRPNNRRSNARRHDEALPNERPRKEGESNSPRAICSAFLPGTNSLPPTRNRLPDSAEARRPSEEAAARRFGFRRRSELVLSR